MIKYLVIISFFILLFCSQLSAKDVFFSGGIVQDKQIISMVQRAKNTVVKRIPKAFKIKWAPEKDPNYHINRDYCRYANSSSQRTKVEEIGELVCIPGNIHNVIYHIQPGGKDIYLVYGVIKLNDIIIQGSKNYPIKRYKYRVNYPIANLEKMKILQTPAIKMSFDNKGKLEKMLISKDCFTESNSGEIHNQRYSKELCSDTIEMGYYDGYKRQVVR